MKQKKTKILQTAILEANRPTEFCDMIYTKLRLIMCQDKRNCRFSIYFRS